MRGTAIIKGGTIADGSGAPLFKADIAIRDGRIVEMGENLKGDVVIPADGCVVAPGFIDIHTHYDAQLFWDPACTSSCWHGVTTVVIGNCGYGLAPCRPDKRAHLIRMMLELEDMPTALLEAGLDWSFTTFPEYLARIEGLKPSVNVAAYVGHSPIRIDVMGDAAYERAANEGEIMRMAALVREAMEAGAIGFATSSAPSGRRSATGHADEQEVVALGRAMAESGRGVVALVPGGYTMPRARMYELQEEVGRPFTWTALMSMPDGSHRDAAALHRAHRKWGTQVYPQVSGRPQTAMTTLRSAFALRTPTMLALEGKPEAERLRSYRDPDWRAKVTTEQSGLRFAVSWDRWLLTDSPNAPQLNGRNLVDIAAERGASAIDTLFDLVVADNLATRFTVVQYNYQEDEVADLLNLDGAILGLADSGAHPDQICDAVLPTDLLGKWVRDKSALPIEKAIRKLTGELADLFGLDRGYLRVGASADITVFDPDTVAPGPLRRVTDQPGNSERLIADRPTGMRHIMVNGTLVRQDGAQLDRPVEGGAGLLLKGQ
jgi:N-acyl-D-amino-acid deacylase